MKYFDVNPYYIDERELNEITELLKNGAVMIFPTDTVYALGCLLSQKQAIKKLYKITGKKPEKTKLSIFCHNLKEVANYTKHYSTELYRFVNRLAPGPYTFIFGASKETQKQFNSKRTEVGIRIPDNDFLSQLLAMASEPIVTTSLNKNDEFTDYYTNSEDIIVDFIESKVDFFVDSGNGKNIPSSVVDCTTNKPRVIREGLGKF